MADYYTNFSLVLPLKRQPREYALRRANQALKQRQEDEPLPVDFPSDLAAVVEDWVFETEIQGKELWLHSQSGGQDAACVFLQHLLQRFSFAGGVAFEWSHDCSKPRTDAFGGGAAFVTATEIQTMTTSQWLQQLTG